MWSFRRLIADGRCVIWGRRDAGVGEFCPGGLMAGGAVVVRARFSGGSGLLQVIDHVLPFLFQGFGVDVQELVNDAFLFVAYYR